MDENMDMDTDIAQAQVMLQLRQMTISREQPPASLPAVASSESVASLASVSSMSQADSGMGSDSDKVSFLDLKKKTHWRLIIPSSNAQSNPNHLKLNKGVNSTMNLSLNFTMPYVHVSDSSSKPSKLTTYLCKSGPDHIIFGC